MSEGPEGDEELESSLGGGGPGTDLAAEDDFADRSTAAGVEETGGVLEGGEARGTFLTSIMLRISKAFSLAGVGVGAGVVDGFVGGAVEGGGGLEE